MTAHQQPNDQEEIRRLLHAINEAWTHGRADDLADYFDERIVIINPGFQGRLVGRRECIESYRDFADQATVHDYAESDIAIDLHGDTAVATYRYAIAYAMDGATRHDVGHDLFVFARQAGEGGRWRAVWRTLIPEAADA